MYECHVCGSALRPKNILNFKFIQRNAGQALLVTEDHFLSKFQDNNDDQKFSFIENWLNDQMERYESGIFMLQMERGTGKTTFTNSIDELAKGKKSFMGYNTRAIYIDEFEHYESGTFAHHLVRTLAMDSEGGIFISDSENNLFNVQSKSKKSHMAKILNFFADQYRQYNKSLGLLLVLEGLDQIHDKKDDNIFDYIPNPSQLNPGVYILLTSRTPAELHAQAKIPIETLTVTAKACFGRKTRDCRDWLDGCLDQYFPNMACNLKMELLEKADFRVINLNFLRIVIGIKGVMIVNHLPDEEDAIHFFLNKIREYYAVKFYERVCSLLGKLSRSNRPLTLSELCFLNGVSTATLNTWACLNDIRGILKIERSEQGNIYSLAHPRYRQMISNYLLK